jgi:hypothetical protein
MKKSDLLKDKMVSPSIACCTRVEERLVSSRFSFLKQTLIANPLFGVLPCSGQAV